MQGRDGSLSFATLVIASVSSAAAALLTSLFWESGTVAAAAFTPVIVSIVSEALKKPASTISQVRASRRERTPARAGAAGAGPSAGTSADAQGRGATAITERPPRAPASSLGGRGVTRVAGRRINMRLALVTGALAFVVAAAFLTLPELLVGQSIAGQPGRTTLGGGSSVDRSGEETDPAPSGDPAGGDGADPEADPEAAPGSEDPAPDPEAGAAGDDPPGAAAPETRQRQRVAPGQGGAESAPTEPQQGQPSEPQQP